MMRRGFTLVEMIIAMTLALVISGVLFFAFFTTQKNTDRGVEILNYLRKATILVERLKMDIRAALAASGSVTATPTTVTIQRTSGDQKMTVTYTFNPAKHSVSRSAPGENRQLGGDGAEGNVALFSVKPVEKLPGFYKIDVVFEAKQDMKANANGATPNPASATEAPLRRNYEFHTLVNKRAPEDSDQDIKWHFTYD
jgi:prepilin-type N-terminal cleavage/methylation domain-containing protein